MTANPGNPGSNGHNGHAAPAGQPVQPAQSTATSFQPSELPTYRPETQIGPQNTSKPQATAGIDTRSIHSGYTPDNHFGSINVPIYASTTYAQNAPNDLRGGYEYGRVANPTVDALARTIADLEGVNLDEAVYGRVFSSGMAATDLLLRAILRPGDHLIMGNDAYGGTHRLIDTVFKQWGVEFDVVDTTNPQQIADALRPRTKIVWLETPTNPLLAVTDIAAVATVLDNARETLDADARLIVDNTFASPYLQRPLELGADIVLHSTTKYLGGHSDVVGGAVVCKDATLDQELNFLLGGVGPVMSPFDAYLTARGIKTLGVRMDRHCSNAQAIAEFLAGREEVAQVLFPGLPDHPTHAAAVKQMDDFGGMISIRLHSEEAARVFVQATKVICLAESLGGVESLVEHPTSMTHQSVVGSQLEVPRDLVRLSIGIENVEDLLADLAQALDAVAAA